MSSSGLPRSRSPWFGLVWCGIGVLALVGCEAGNKTESADVDGSQATGTKPADTRTAGPKPRNPDAKVVEFTQADFDEQVLRSPLPVLVDFTATWCGPCRALAPVVEELASDFHGKVRMGKVDIDQNPELSAKYVGGQGIPLVLIFKQGEVIAYASGFGPGTKEGLTDFLSKVDTFVPKKKPATEGAADTTAESDSESDKKSPDTSKEAEPDAKPASEKPASEKPASEKPASEKPASEKPASEKPASDSAESGKPTGADK